MAKMKLSKQAMQQQREQLKLYQRLLPSLDLKRRQLQVETQKARQEFEAAKNAVDALDAQIGAELPMLADEELELKGLVRLEGYSVVEENVVGIRLPMLERIECVVAEYSRLATPAWRPWRREDGSSTTSAPPTGSWSAIGACSAPTSSTATRSWRGERT